MTENVSKLKIVSYSDVTRKDVSESMEVQVNPESYTQKINIRYSEKQAPGTSAKMPKFSKIEPQKMDFELLFDSTGVLNGKKNSSNGVEDDIRRLKQLTVEYKGKMHRPRFLSIYWGTLKFDCCVESIDITYKLFNADGLPLRAVAKLSLTGAMDDEKRVAVEKASSPDLTHVRVVKEGDTLPLMTYHIYGDSKYYISVARVNKLKDFRNLVPGQEIIFPPIKK